MIPTIFTVLCVVTGVGFCWMEAYSCKQCANAALAAAQRAEASELRLKVMRADVIALRTHVGALEGQLTRLQGRVYAQPRRAPDDIGAALRESPDPSTRRAGAAHDALGVGLATEPRLVQDVHPKGCYCDTCVNGPVGAVQETA